VLFARVFRRRLQNARDFAQFWIGARLLHRSGLERVYGLPAEKIDIRFAEKRMLWIKEHASIRRYLSLPRSLKRSEPPSIPNKQLAHPREGFTHLYQVAAQRLERSGVTFRLGAKMLSLKKKDGLFFLDTDERRVAASGAISTIPLERVQELCGIVSEEKLQSVTLISLFFSFSGDRGFKDSVL